MLLSQSRDETSLSIFFAKVSVWGEKKRISIHVKEDHLFKKKKIQSGSYPLVVAM